MRWPLTGRGHLPRVDSTTLHLWHCDDAAAGDDLTDLIDGGETLTLNGTAAVADCPVGKARDLSGGGRYVGSTTGAERLNTIGEVTVSALIKTGTTPGVIAQYGGSGEDLGTGTMLQLQTDTDGEIWLFWEETAANIITSSVWQSRPNRWYLIQVVRRDEGSTFGVDLYVNGEYVEEMATGQVKPTTGQGADAFWTVGCDSGQGQVWPGQIGYVHVSEGARTAAQLRAEMLEAIQYASPTQIDCRVDLEDGNGTMRDMTSEQGYNWVERVSFEDNVDKQVVSASIGLTRSIDGLSLASLREDSRLNLTDDTDLDSYGPLLDDSRDVDVYFARIPLWTRPVASDWHLFFRGEIEDLDEGGDPVKVNAMDRGVDLQRVWIRDETEYSTGGTDDIEDVIDDILADWTTGHTLVTPVASNFVIREYEQRQQAVSTSVRDLASLKAWDCRYRHNQDTDDMDLVLFDPDRDRTDVDIPLGPSNYYDYSSLKRSRKDVRTRIRVMYPRSVADGGTLDTDGDPILVKKEVTADAATVTKYGDIFAASVLDVHHHLDTDAEATLYAEGILSDLSSPFANHGISAPLLFELEVYDRCSLQPNGEHYTTPQKTSVTSLSHVWEADGGGESTYQTRGKPSVGMQRWHHQLGRSTAGKGASDSPPNYPKAADITVTEQPGGIIVEIPKIPGWNSRVRDIEVHTSSTISFTPSSSTLRARGLKARQRLRDVPRNTLQYVKAIVVGDDDSRAELDLGTATAVWPDVIAYVASDSVPTSTTDPVPYDTETIDDGGNWNTSSHKFVAPFDGVYEVFASVGFGPDSPSDDYNARVEISRTPSGGSLATVAVGTIVGSTDPGGVRVATCYYRGPLDANDEISTAFFYDSTEDTPEILGGSLWSFISITCQKELY